MCIRDRILTNGALLERVRNNLRKIIGAKYVTLTSTGTHALELLLRSLKLTGRVKGDLAIIPDYTFIATLNAVYRSGFKPIIIDVTLKSWTIDPDSLNRALEETEADLVIAVDPFGFPADYDLLLEICEKHSAVLVSDSSESLGAKYRGVPLGTQALAHTFSFSPTKIVTAGEGGAIATNDEELAFTLEKLRDYGRGLGDKGIKNGTNSRISEINLAILYLGLKKLSDLIELRYKQYMRYRDRLEPLGFRFQDQEEKEPAVSYTVAILMDDAQKVSNLRNFLISKGIETKQYFLPLTSLIMERHYPTPNSYKLFRGSLALPTGHHLSEEEQEEILKAISIWFREH